jgi:predicted nucleic acid-binding protein
MSGRVVLDSNTIIDVLNGHISREYFKRAVPDTERIISVITEIEILSFPRLTDEQETWIKVFLEEMEIVPLTEEIKRKTIEFRRRANTKLPDSIIVATSIVSNATLITRDKKLLNVLFPGLHAMPVPLTSNK